MKVKLSNETIWHCIELLNKENKNFPLFRWLRSEAKVGVFHDPPTILDLLPEELEYLIALEEKELAHSATVTDTEKAKNILAELIRKR